MTTGRINQVATFDGNPPPRGGGQDSLRDRGAPLKGPPVLGRPRGRPPGGGRGGPRRAFHLPPLEPSRRRPRARRPGPTGRGRIAACAPTWGDTRGRSTPEGGYRPGLTPANNGQQRLPSAINPQTPTGNLSGKGGIRGPAWRAAPRPSEGTEGPNPRDRGVPRRVPASRVTRAAEGACGQGTQVLANRNGSRGAGGGGGDHPIWPPGAPPRRRAPPTAGH